MFRVDQKFPVNDSNLNSIFFSNADGTSYVDIS